MSSREQTFISGKAASRPRSPKPIPGPPWLVARQPRWAANVQRAESDPGSLSPQDVRQLQRAIGNRAVGRLLGQPPHRPAVQQKPNGTGLPDGLKAGLENLSGLSMDSVRVHYNSAKPKQLRALAYTQGTDIHLGPGQDRHLPHEGWHAVQQMQGRVKPTMQAKDVAINDDTTLEREADVMGAKAMQMRGADRHALDSPAHPSAEAPVIQRIGRGQILVEPSETYLWDPAKDESFSIRGNPQVNANQQAYYVVAANDPYVAIICNFFRAGSSIKLRAQDNGEVLAEFKVEQSDDSKGGSEYLTHMEVKPTLKRQSIGKTMLRLCINQFGFFRIGTQPNMDFFRPAKKEEIELTEEGDAFISRMLDAGIIGHDRVFPMDYREEFQRMFAAQQEEQSEEPEEALGGSQEQSE